MLTVDLVTARRRGDSLQLRELDARTRARARELSEEYLGIVSRNLGEAREMVVAGLDCVDVLPREKKLADGLKKLVLDRCVFEMHAPVEPSEIRSRVFKAASLTRAVLHNDEVFDRERVIRKVAEELRLEPEQIERFLFADLRDSHKLLSFDEIGAGEFVELYERSMRQAVLLKASKVTISLTDTNLTNYRPLFRRMKFLRLLHTIERQPSGGFRVDIDGPFSLFSSVTKYGLRLAMLLPVLEQYAHAWRLDATLIWGKDRRRLFYTVEAPGRPLCPCSKETQSPEYEAADDVVSFVEKFEKLGSSWRAYPSDEILNLPGVGMCIPDLVFEQPFTQEKVFFEVMGYWSRDAVWKRVELVEAGLARRVIFAVSSRLRVSEEVLPDESPGSLYVYKGVMNPRRVLEKLEKT